MSCPVFEREYRGKSVIDFVNDYCVLDLETTGLSPQHDKIIEVSVLKVRNNMVIDSFSTLCNPQCVIDDFIVSLTGITNDMVRSAPLIEEVILDVLRFIGNDLVVGHNVSFDVNFVYDNAISSCGIFFENDFLDTMRLFRMTHKELPHHRLSDLISFYDMKGKKTHRALNDCEYTHEGYQAMKNEISCEYGNYELFFDKFCTKKRCRSKSIDLKTLVSNCEPNYDSPLYKKIVVFTGTLSKLTRVEAAQLVVDIGGICGNSVTKKTNFLVLGNNDYCPTIKGGKSTKQKKAEEYILDGCDLLILSENEFYSLVMEG